MISLGSAQGLALDAVKFVLGRFVGAAITSGTSFGTLRKRVARSRAVRLRARELRLPNRRVHSVSDLIAGSPSASATRATTGALVRGSDWRRIRNARVARRCGHLVGASWLKHLIRGDEPVAYAAEGRVPADRIERVVEHTRPEFRAWGRH